MADESWKTGSQCQFVIRCWLETERGGKAFWRGRVHQIGGDHAAFEDAQRLLDFILERLRQPDGIELPLHRDRQSCS